MKFLKNYQNAFKGRPCVHIFSTIEDDYGSPYIRSVSSVLEFLKIERTNIETGSSHTKTEAKGFFKIF